MRVVLDCNVLISAGLADGICRKVINEVLIYHEIILSAPILLEYTLVADRPRFSSCSNELKSLIWQIERIAVIVEPAKLAFDIRDSDDEVYLATAAVGGAVLITGNTRDFTELRYGSVDIWSPREFLNQTT